MTDRLYLACVIFFIVDLTFVGVICYCVVKWLKILWKELDAIHIHLHHTDKRNFIEKG